MDLLEDAMDTAFVMAPCHPASSTPAPPVDTEADYNRQSGLESDLTDTEQLEANLEAFSHHQAAASAKGKTSTDASPLPQAAPTTSTKSAKCKLREHSKWKGFREYKEAVRRVQAINNALPPGATPVQPPPAPANYKDGQSRHGQKQQRLGAKLSPGLPPTSRLATSNTPCRGTSEYRHLHLREAPLSHPQAPAWLEKVSTIAMLPLATCVGEATRTSKLPTGVCCTVSFEC